MANWFSVLALKHWLRSSLQYSPCCSSSDDD